MRISGLFRDVFPEQIALFDAATQAVAARDDESAAGQPAARRRQPSAVFGAAPGRLRRRRRAARRWRRLGDAATELGEAYLAATRYAYDGGEASAATGHSATASLTRKPSSTCRTWRGRTCSIPTPSPSTRAASPPPPRRWARRPRCIISTRTDPQKPKARTLAQEAARALRARAANPAWLKGQMRHGFRGAAEIAETVDNLYLFAATTDAVADRQFDLLFDAVCGDGEVRDVSRRAPIPQPPPPSPTVSPTRCGAGCGRRRRNSVEPLLQALRGAA